ncbi:MAG: 16S rRNA (cytosine(967)-C(5))-methyltransferase RsmB [Proteobacteria bacterium]|nr:16S rRNA (cytosine(967)-C(5))-methyltransferase RsmB [Pseudomonadota bacterium]
MTVHARESALNILNTLDKKNLTLDMVMNDFTEGKIQLDKRDMSLVNALVYGVIRWRGHIDYIIAHFSKTPLEKIKPEILNTLRLGVFQLKFLSRIPESAAVNTSVDLAKKNGPVWVVKFVNGVLRNIARNLDSVPFPNGDENLTLSISLGKSFPTWLIQKWLNRFGEEETLQLCDHINSIPEITIRTNTLKTDKTALFESLDPHVKDLMFSEFATDGLSFTHPDQAIFLLPPFKDGWFQVQDEAAQLVSQILCPCPGERVLDACAGLGGKTGHLAQLMGNRGEIIALDHDGKKLARLNLDMKRLGISIVKTQIIDLEKPFDSEKLGYFDRILVDAPCSGMGVIRRNPDSKWSLTKKNLNRYKKRQVRFLSALSEQLKPSGVMVYAVCSFEPEENEAVIDSFLHQHPDFMIIHDNDNLPSRIAVLKNSKGCFVSLPHIHHMDGFFMVRLKRMS